MIKHVLCHDEELNYSIIEGAIEGKFQRKTKKTVDISIENNTRIQF